MKTLRVWDGAKVAIGERIEIKITMGEDGDVRMHVSAPAAESVRRLGGAKPPRRRGRLPRWPFINK